ncbi:DcrB family lipoprotein [Enterobacteriaceae bacterium LUAb1]
MQKFVKHIAVALLIVGLTSCDGNNEKTVGQPHATRTSQTAQTISLLDGKLSFTLPPGMADTSDKLSTHANNMHVYADESGQRAIIVIIDAPATDDLATLARRIEQQQHSRVENLQVINNKNIDVQNQSLQQLDTIIPVNDQSVWSSVLLGKIDNKLMTMQITLPADNQQQAQSDAENIIKTLQIK